jgi:hypothetical protein
MSQQPSATGNVIAVVFFSKEKKSTAVATETEGVKKENQQAVEAKDDVASQASGSEGDEAFLDEEAEDEDDEARADALRAGHHRLLVRQQRHGGAHAPDQEPAQVSVHASSSAAAAAASCLCSNRSSASCFLDAAVACGVDRGREA